MKRGRKRQFDPTMPAHINQRELPGGVYWDRSGRGHWYVFHVDPEGVRRRKKIAGPDAKLSELHALIEDDADRNSLGWLLDQFHGSLDFKKKIGARTQRDYGWLCGQVKAVPTSIGPLGGLSFARLTLPTMQRVFDRIAAATPSKSNHMLRYLRRVFSWGMQRGFCKVNPCRGVEQALEAAVRVMPERIEHSRVLALVQAAGALPARSKGSCAPYLWIVLELGYLLRLRPIETITLTDANLLEHGISTNRRKGSNDNVTAWSPRLRAAVDAAIALRARQMVGKPIPMRPEQRVLVVSEDGAALKRSSLDSAWQRFMRYCVREGMIAPEQRFGLHAMKHRGITDTPGTRGQKQMASGHKNERMLDTYDHELPVVEPAGKE